MRNIFAIIMMVIVYSCSSSSKATRVPRDTKKFIQLCADSINRSKELNVLPVFLYDSCFDYRKKYWLGLHKPLTLRKMVIDKVKNKEAIEYILSLNDKRLNQTCGRLQVDTIGLTYFRIPDIEKSFAYLLQERLKELK